MSYNPGHYETNGAAVDISNQKVIWHIDHVIDNHAEKNASRVSDFLQFFLWAFRTRFADQGISVKARLLFLLRTCLHPRLSLHWYAFLYHGYLRKAVQANGFLLDAIHRPFFDHQLPLPRRLGLLKNHFHLCQVFFGKVLAREILAGKAHEIAKFKGKNGEQFHLALFWGCTYKREGGLTLGLFLDGAILQCLTFSFDRYKNDVAIKVGGIQASNHHSQESIRVATKALHGIQPRLLLIDALRSLAAGVGCTSIECVAKRNHIYQAWRYKFSKNIRAEYDQLWLAAGGTPHANGNFILPLFVADKPVSSRPANKRSEYRAREGITHAMRSDITVGLQTK
ncbi:MAG: DUF535 family protein [Burkholderiales bacterium]|nr:DUF535 family protein [Burkholderiales bacterium]